MNTVTYIKEFTKIYQEETNKNFREAKCSFYMHEMNHTPIQKDDYFVSSFPSPVVGFGSRGTGFLYYYNEEKFQEVLASAPTKEKKELQELYDFWVKEQDKTRLRASFPAEMKEAMPKDDFEVEYHTAYPLYRLSGGYLNYEKLLAVGIDGVIAELQNRRERQDNDFLRACYQALEDFKRLITLYRDDAKNVNQGIYETLDALLQHKPETMRQAIQLMWLYIGVSEVRNYGRMDEIIAPFWENEKSAYRDIAEYFKVIENRNTIFNGRIILGGRGRTEKNADTICKTALRVMKDLHLTEPQLTLRCYDGMDQEVFKLALECIGDGCSYPLLYNDEINIPNVQRTFNVSLKEAEQYVPFGCGEFVINHKSVGSPNGIINLSKVLEGMLNTGQCMLTGEKITKRYFEQPETFEELYEEYQKEVDYQLKILAEQEKLEYDYMNDRCAFLYNSILYDDCIERGKAVLDGGIEYVGGTIETYGNINAADSLYAIKKLVFDERKVTLKELVHAIKINFEGKETLRNDCLEVTKYGNNDNKVDAFANEFNQFVALQAKEKAAEVGLDTYLVVIINNDANSKLGFRTAASCDGRKAREPLANALTPQSGAEKTGITAVLNTVSSISVDNMAGAVYNLKLSKEMAKKHLLMVKELFKVYFAKGGSQIMISVIDQSELEDAMVHPEKYPNLIVRVGGFSARFIDLLPIVQKEIVSRMIY